jgi:hypothetical protein
MVEEVLGTTIVIAYPWPVIVRNGNTPPIRHPLSVTSITKPREWLPITLVTALAVAARIAVIRQPMRFDEAISWAYYVGRSWTTIVTSYTYPNNHVFHSLLAKAAGAPADYAPWALRLPALLAGIAVILLLWEVGRRFTDDRTALLAAGLAAGSAELTLYSANARGYSLVVAAFLALLIIAHRLRVQQSAPLWVAFAVTGGLGIYTIPVMLYPLGVATTWLLLQSRSASGQRRTFVFSVLAASLAAVVVAALLYTPILTGSGAIALTGNRFVASTTWSQFGLELVPMTAGMVSAWMSPMPPFAGYLLIPLALAGALPRRGERRSSLAVAALMWCGALLMLTHRAPFVRVWLFLLPLFLLAVARGFWRCVEHIIRPAHWAERMLAIAVALLLTILMLSNRSVERNDETGRFAAGSDVAALIGRHLRPGDRVIAAPPANGPLLYYMTRAGLDSSSLTLTLDRTRRALLVLDVNRGQSIAWARANAVIDDVAFTSPQLLARFPEAEVWLLERR